MQLDQLGHQLDLVARVAEGLHPRTRHPCTDHLVVVEGHPSVDERTCPRLADVVEERGEAEQPIGRRLVHHREGVGEHVLVPVDRVLFERETGQLGEELAGQPGPTTNQRPTEGTATTMILSSSSRIRSAETIERRP